jgi:hypothetical protein
MGEGNACRDHRKTLSGRGEVAMEGPAAAEEEEARRGGGEEPRQARH